MGHARKALFDLVIAAAAGQHTDASVISQRAARVIWGTGPSPVWFSGERLTPAGAAFANSAMASALDLDDGHRAAAGHPGASIIPAVLAVAADIGADHQDIMTAIVLGYEVAVRIAASRDFAALTTMVTGPWVGQGAAAAAAWLRGADQVEIAQAIVIAGATAPNLNAVGYSKVMGNHLKEGIPWATATGVSAADLAMRGYTGPTDMLDNDKLFDPAVLLPGHGTGWAIEGAYQKLYSCCRWAHAAIDAMLEVREETPAAIHAAERIEVKTFDWATRLNNEPAPNSLESAQYSVPFCVALAALRGRQALARMTDEYLADREVIALSRRIFLSIDPELDLLFPLNVPARLILHLHTGRVEKTIMAPLGEPANPLDWRALTRKFNMATANFLSEPDRTTLLTAFADLEAGKLASILAALEGQPAIRPSAKP
jgi:2-methylcitrate dehydratase PrpD